MKRADEPADQPSAQIDAPLTEMSTEVVTLEHRPVRWRKRAAPYGLLAPGGVWLILFFIIPIASMLYVSLESGSLGSYTFDWHVENYVDAVRLYRTNLIRSLSYATVVTIISLLLAYPVAYWIAFHGGRRKSMYLLLLLLPFFVSFIIRTIQWQFILGDEGILLGPLKDAGLLPNDFHVLSTPISVIAGMVYNFLPFTALPLFVSLDRISPALVEAGQDLYADRAMTFRKVIWPLSLPGVFAAVLLTFVPAVGDYVNAELLGGPGTRLLGNVIQTEFLVNTNYPLAASLSFIIMSILLVGAVIYVRMLGTGEVTSVAAGGAVKASREERSLRRGPRRRWTRFILPTYTGLFLAYLISPIVVMIVFGFNDPSGRFNVKWEGFSLDAYRSMFANTDLTQSLRVSLTIGVLSACLATVFGTLIGLALGRYRFRGQSGAIFIIFLAIASPEIVLGSALLTMFVSVNVPLGLSTILIAHVMFSIAFVAVTVRARVEGLDRSLDDAGADLGADPIRTFFLVTLPLILPGVIAGAMLAFALSIDDFVITNFVAGPQTTFPLWVYGASRIGIPPQVNVMGTLLFAFGLMLVFVQWVSSRRRS